MTIDPVQHAINLYRDGLDLADWYDVAHADIIIVARYFGVRPEYLAGLLASFSPRTSVLRSIRNTYEYLRTETFNQDVPRTVRATVTNFVETGRVRGPKIGPFYLALLGDPDALVIDTHVLRAFSVPIKPSQAQWNTVTDTIRQAARNRATVARFQAALWCGQFRATNRTPKYMPLLEELYNEHP